MRITERLVYFCVFLDVVGWGEEILGILVGGVCLLILNFSARSEFMPNI